MSNHHLPSSLRILHPRQNAPPSLAPPGVIPDYVDPPTIGNQVIVASMTLVVFALGFVLVRLLIKWRIVKKWGWDDLLISIAAVLALARAIVSTINARDYGLGLHVWDINPLDLVTIGETQKNLLFVANMIYLLAIMCTKIAILLLYLQIFRVEKTFRYLCYTMIAFVSSYCITFFFLQAFSCNPVAKVWHSLTFVGKYSCIDYSKMDFVIGGFNIGTDFVILVMPFPLIWNLHLSFRHKIGLLMVFATGIFVCATTIVREVIVVRTLRDVDQSYVTVPETIWLTAELNIGIICACLPSFAPLKNRHIFGNLVPASFQSFLRKSFDSFSRGSSKASSRRAGEDQGSDINVELVDAGKASTRIYSSGEPWVSAEGNILRETVMSVDYSKGLDVEGRI